MTKRIAKRVSGFQEYIFSKLEKTVSSIKKKTGKHIINLGPGSPSIQPSKIYINKLSEFNKESGAHLYPGYQSIPEFSKALIYWYKNRFNVNLKTEETIPLLGAKDGVSHLPLALLNKGDEILVPNPGYPAYIAPAIMIEAVPVSYDLLPENNFKISIKNLEKKITKKTRCIWINFPSNPTGQTISIEELKKIISFCKYYNIIILYDNAYSEITFDGFVAPSILQIPGAKNIAVELGSFSKTFSFAGFRMGWMVGNKEIVAALSKIKSQFDSGLSIPLQKLGAFALIHQDKKWHKEMINTYDKRRKLITDKLKKLGLAFTLPQGSLYIWARIPQSAKNSTGFAMELLSKEQILVTPGIAFGSNGDRYIRISICANINSINRLCSN